MFAAHADIFEENRAHVLELRGEEQRVGEYSRDLLPALYRLAEWYESVHENHLARPVYRRIVRITEASYGEQDLRLVQPLTHIALTYERESNYRQEGRAALERAVQLLESSPEASGIDRADAYIRLGDWHLLSEDRDQAVTCYSRAWFRLVAAEEGSNELAESRLGKPVRIEKNGGTRKLPIEPDDNFVVVEFTVLPDGTIDDVALAQSSGVARIDRQVQLYVRQARYRPALADGKAVSSRVRLQQQYRKPP